MGFLAKIEKRTETVIFSVDAGKEIVFHAVIIVFASFLYVPFKNSKISLSAPYIF